MSFKNQDKLMSYVNNNINWDQFNQLYDFLNKKKYKKNRHICL